MSRRERDEWFLNRDKTPYSGINTHKLNPVQPESSSVISHLLPQFAKSPGIPSRGFLRTIDRLPTQAMTGTVSWTRAGADAGTGTPVPGAAIPRVRRWTKWYGGQGPETCIWQSRKVALVVANLFW